ncbi:amino acid deaminase [Nocardia camponoti]|uniref:amino acid deaminase n=1 Tax=Nocardia camponoti TaxID=1616106 RepID=UPI0016650C29|nr:amino acid deaminase [Nocardia camponoti]
MTIDNAVVDALANATLGPHDKSVPPTAWGETVRDFLVAEPRMGAFATPLLTLDRGRLDSNLAVMADWAAAAGVALAPHGKTTMAPQLWREQFDAGAWGITLATLWQVQVARSVGVSRIMLANTAIDPVGLRWLAGELGPDFECYCWADSVATVESMNDILRDAPAGPPVRVIVELGAPGGRTGARTRAEAHEIAKAVSAAERLELAGVGGYEGALAHDRSAAGLDAVRDYLADMAVLHVELADEYPGHAVVTAGGSAYPDLVVEQLAGLADASTTVVLRSGAYLVHDDGFYAGISPLTAPAVEPGLRAAMHGWARVVSRPEPELALLDGGKRDFPFDEGLPVPQQVFGGSLPAGSHVSALNDQHTFLRLPGASASDLPVGSVVRLGLSHPCTAFDKWRLIPVLDDADAANPRVVDLVRTFF